MPQKKIFRKFVFDLDNTLIDSHGAILKSFRHAVAPFGIEMQWHDFEIMRAKKTSELFDHLLTPEQSRIAVERLIVSSREQATQVPLFEGVQAILKALNEQGFESAVWTGRDRDSAMDLIRNHELHDCFVSVLGNSCTPNNKPHPDGLLKLVRDHDWDLSEVLMVGDHPHDLEGARSAGCAFAGVSWGHSEDDLKLPHFVQFKNEADYFFRSIPEFLECVRTEF